MEECHKLLTDQVDDAILSLSLLEDDGGILSDVGLEHRCLDQFWIKGMQEDIAAMYCSLSLGFKDNDSTLTDSHSEGDRQSLRNSLAYLKSVPVKSSRSLETTYHPMTKWIINFRCHLWTRNLVIRHRVEDFQLGIESYQTQLNLTKPRWEATGFEYKHDYTVIDSPRAVTFRDRYGVQMIMRFNEIHKFSDGTLQQIDEALDYRVKEFQINRTNPGMNTRFWTKKDVDRSKDFIFAIPERLRQTYLFLGIWRSFVGGTDPGKATTSRRDLPRDNPLVSVEVLRYDYKRSYVRKNKGIGGTERSSMDLTQTRLSNTYTGNPVKEILLKMHYLITGRSSRIGAKMELETLVQ
ncbi:hypothetical protein Tco_0517198 [Tanacetum coccineum]